jgi:hypothetical protein
MGRDGAYKHGSEGVQRVRAQVFFDIVDRGRDAQAAALSVVRKPLYQRIRSRRLERLCIGRLFFPYALSNGLYRRAQYGEVNLRV